ncbi:hypothetical protein [Stenotrophomonas sp. 24(2023)]|uniref:hypothetical protein n=1 Tax=Stenotrophomonas sp. 24(2023) TaxID=3068324 RepID=UPI0027DEED47|nr:hypothetical protein [Stenotrophomonas sp. 24(2023)]WMJ69265.1 hypothetical protein Q9R17_19145 [Stenotrophomonas sp. 24(2023)]
MDSSSQRGSAVRCAAIVLLALPMLAAASGARQGVKAQPGEVVLLRDVAARPAYRMAPPGVALIADPKPQRELAAALGSGDAGGMQELSEDDYAGMGASRAAGLAGPGSSTVERTTQQALQGTLGRTGEGALGGSLNSALGGPLGAVGSTTRGIGATVQGALAQFPMGAPTPAGGK